MKTFTFPYGAGEWDSEIDVTLSDKDAALLEKSMQNKEFFHLEEDPRMANIEWKVSKAIFKENKRMMIEDGRISKNARDEDVYDELGNFRICFPNAFKR